MINRSGRGCIVKRRWATDNTSPSQGKISLYTLIKAHKMSLVSQIKDINRDADTSERKRAIAYSMDLLIPGLYVWLGNFTLRLFGEKPDDTPYKYPGILNSRFGIALVLPGLRIFTTYKDSYDPR